MKPAYNVKTRVLAAIGHVLTPLVRILLRNGISFYDFADTAKETYVKVCQQEFTPGEGQVSEARIAVLSGLTRRDVRIALDAGEKKDSGDLIAEPVSRVLQGWHEDKDFLGPYGVPRSLHYDADPTKSHTFVDLVKRYRSDMDPEAVLEILMRSRAVVRPDGESTINVARRYVIMDSLDPGTLDSYAQAIRRFLETSEVNIDRKVTEKLFQRWVFPDDGIRVEDWDKFARLVKDRLEPAVSDLDTRFASFVSPKETNEEGMAVGVGIYVYRDRGRQ